MTVLVTALVLLAAVTVLHLLLTFALIRRVRVLQERLASAPSTAPDSVPAAGTAVGEFTADLVGGGTLRTTDLADGALVGFFSAHCTPCEAVVDDLVANPPAERFVAFVDRTDDEPAADLVARLAPIAEVGLFTAASPVAAAFAHQGFPTLVRTSGGVVTEAGHSRGELHAPAVR